LEKVYAKIHEEIRKNPDRVKKERAPTVPVYTDKRKTIVDTGKKDKAGKPILYKTDRKFTHQERKDRVAAKIKKALSKKKWEKWTDDNICN